MTLDTPAITDEAYRKAALNAGLDVPGLELDDEGIVSRRMGGAYVAAFIWVPAEVAQGNLEAEKGADR